MKFDGFRASDTIIEIDPDRMVIERDGKVYQIDTTVRPSEQVLEPVED